MQSVCNSSVNCQIVKTGEKKIRGEDAEDGSVIHCKLHSDEVESSSPVEEDLSFLRGLIQWSPKWCVHKIICYQEENVFCTINK